MKLMPVIPDVSTLVAILSAIFGALWGAIKLLINPLKKDLGAIQTSVDKLAEGQTEMGKQVVKVEQKLESQGEYLDAVNANLKESTRTQQRAYNELSELKGIIKNFDEFRKRGD